MFVAAPLSAYLNPKPMVLPSKALAAASTVTLILNLRSFSGNGNFGSGGGGRGDGFDGGEYGFGGFLKRLLFGSQTVVADEPQSQEWDLHRFPANIVVQLNKLSGLKKYKVSEILFFDRRRKYRRHRRLVLRNGIPKTRLCLHQSPVTEEAENLSQLQDVR
ncbi:hypothetical protein FF1_000019 [Malus domestica]